MKGWAACGLAAASMLVVGWIWHRPQALSVANEFAERATRLQVKRRIAQDSPADLDARTDLWMRDHPDQVATTRQALSQRFRESMSFSAADGRRYAYLGDLDSYAWVRKAENYLRHGTVCDEVRDGECLDTFVNPPHGVRTSYARSLHVAAIVVVHRVISWFEPATPLTVSAAWVAILAGSLTSLLSFLVGQRLSGIYGGVSAALLIPLHPFVLERCLGSDNDVWNLGLPLLFAWLTATAMESGEWRRRLLALAGAGTVAGLHAMTWDGWLFHGAAILAGAGLYVVSRLRAPALAPHQRAEAVASFALLVTSVAAAVLLSGGWENASARIREQVSGWAGTAAAAPRIVEDGLWPPMLETVNELRPTTFQRLVPGMVGRVACAVTFAGFAAVLLPRRTPWWGLIGAAVYGLSLLASVNRPDLGPAFYVGATLVPLLAVVTWRLWRPQSSAGPSCIDLTIALWFVAGLDMSFHGARYVILAVPPFALLAAAAIGRMAERLADELTRRSSRRQLSGALVTAIVIGALIPAVSRGYAAASSYSPALDTAWSTVLSYVRTRSAADAVVTTWWDYGYWVKYIAQRRTTADGASLQSHRPYWIAQTLVSRAPEEAVGLLRMLNCGGDSMPPSPDDEAGAYEQIRRVLNDAVASQALLVELVRQPPTIAAAALAQHGFTTAQREQILRATHCQPPESYLVLSSEMTASDVWTRVGEWDFRKAAIAGALREATPEAVIRDAQARYGLSIEGATELVERAQRLSLFDFVTGKPSRTPPLWYPCGEGPAAGTLRCRIEMEASRGGRVIEAVDVSLVAPAATRLRVSFHNQSQWRDEVPASLILAGDAVTAVPVEPEPSQDLGVLVDVKHRRVMLGHPAFLASLYVRLWYLDGRLTPGFEKVMEQASPFGTRVGLWRIRFS